MKKTLCMILALLVVLAGCAQTTQPDATPAATPEQTAPQGTETEQPDASAEPGTPDEPAKDTLVVALSADALSMDPARHTTYPTGTVLFHIYDPLVTRDANGNIQPWLAKSWELLDDVTWQFKLKEGVTFTNGEPFNAECVKYSLERVLDPDTQAPNKTRIAAIDHVDVVDEYTVNVVTQYPAPTLLQGMAEDGFCAMMVPVQHTSTSLETLGSEPVGTGPYMLKEWVKDDHITLVANDAYWGTAPAIKTIIFRPIPETSTAISELKSGGVDVITNVPPEQMDGLNTDTTKVVAKATDRLFYINVNTLEEGPLQNKLVRQAIAYAIDVDAINESLLGGMAQRTAINLPLEAFGYDASLTPYEYNPEKAKELLAEAGYADGITIPFLSRNGRYIKDKEIVETCAAYLEQVGIHCEVELVEGGVWQNRSENHGRKGIFYPGWSGRDADLVFYPQLASGQSQSYVSDEALDAMIMEARTTMDEAKRLALYYEIDAYLYDQMFQIPLFQSPAIYGVNNALNWEPRNDDILSFRDASF